MITAFSTLCRKRFLQKSFPIVVHSAHSALRICYYVHMTIGTLKDNLYPDKERRFKYISYFLVVALITLGYYFWVGISRADILNYPLVYGTGDISVVLYRSHEMHFDNAIFSFDQLGAPDSSNTFNYYAFDFLILFIQFIISKLTPTYIIGFNAFVLGGAYFNGVATLYAIRRLGFRHLSSVVPAIVMAAQPFFFYRALGHTYLSYYFAVPIAGVLAIELAQGKFAFVFDKSYRLNVRINNLLLLFVIGLSGMYYVYFSVFFFLIAFIYSLFNKRNLKGVLSFIQTALIPTVLMLIAATPYINNIINGTTGILAEARIGSAPDAANNLSLHFLSLLLPVYNHRVTAFANLRNLYIDHSSTEEADIYGLGIILVVSLFVIVICIVVRKLRNELCGLLLVFVASALFVSLRGPINLNIIYINPYIRCYNRISIFIAFFLSVGLAYVLDRSLILLSEKLSGKTIIIELLVVIILSSFAYWDQTGLKQFPTDDVITTSETLFDEESSFVDSIVSDKEMDILIIPYEDFPEGLPQNELRANDLFSLVVHSNLINISFGSIPGTQSYEKLNSIAYQSIESQTLFALSEGYDGIILAITAFDPATASACIDTISYHLGQPDASSSRFVYWEIE